MPLAEPYASFERPGDVESFRGFVETLIGQGAWIDGATLEDGILRVSLASARDYLMQSAGCANRHGETFRVHAGIAETIRPNAFAAKRGDLHLCALQSGLYGAIFELCLFVMAQPGVHTCIGDPAKERGAKLPDGVLPGFWMIDELRRFGEIRSAAVATTIVPVCPERYLFAIALTLMMARFVWFHEQYHCLNGHVGALTAIEPRLCLNEMPGGYRFAGLISIEPSLPLPERDYRAALEFDADRSALWGAYRTQVTGSENIILLQNYAPSVRKSGTIFVGLLMSFIFDAAAGRFASSRPFSHPDGYTRLHNMIRTIATHLLDMDEGAQAAFHAALAELRALRRAVPALVDPSRVLDDCADARFQHELDRQDRHVEIARAHFSREAFR